MSKLKIISLIIFTLITIVFANFLWALTTEKNLIIQLNQNIQIGMSLDEAEEYLRQNSITYWTESKADSPWEVGDFSFQLVFGLDVPYSIIDVWEKRLVVVVKFDDESIVNNVIIEEGYTGF